MSVNMHTMAGWTFTLLSKGVPLRIALTVIGARCLKSATFASPLPPILAVHSMRDTEPADAGCSVANIGTGAEGLILLFHPAAGKPYEPT